MKLHLPKELLAAVLFCVSAAGTTYAATYTPGSVVSLPNVININFAGDQESTDGKSGVTSLPYGKNSFDYGSSAWTTVNGANGTATVTDLLGNQYTLKWSSSGTWYSDVSAETLVGAITKGYLDISQDSSESEASFTLSTTGKPNLDWKQVNIILSGDKKGAFAKVQVGGTEYYYDGGTLTEVSSGKNPTWGTRAGSTTLTKGGNLMCVTNTPGATESSLTVTGKGNGVDRATIAGVQIVLGESLIEAADTGTISGLVEGESVSASGLGLETFYSGKFTVEVTATEVADDVAQLTLDQGLRVGTLNVTGGALRLDVNEEKTFVAGTLELGSNASLALGGTGFISVNSLSLDSGSGKLTLENGVGVTIGTKLASNIAANTFNAGAGSTLSIAGNYTSPADFQAALNSFTGTGTLKFADAQTDVQPYEKPFNVAVTGKKVVFDQGLAFNGTSKTDNSQTFTVGEGAEITVNNRALEARRLNVNVDKGGTLTANAGILIGHSATDNVYPGWVNMSGGKIVTTSIKGQHNNDGSEFTMTDGTLEITSDAAFGLTEGGKKLAVKLQGGTITTTVDQMSLAAAANAESANLKFEIGNVTFDTGTGNTINLNHAFTQTGTLTVTGSGTLNLSGNVTLSDINALSAASYTDKTDTGNGYAGTKRYLIMMENGTGGTSPTLSIADNFTIADANGTTLTYVSDQYGTHIQTGADNSDKTYYINTGDVVYGDTDHNYAAADETTGLVLNGGNLILDKELTVQAQTGTGIVVQQAATMTINEGVTLAQGNLTANAATELKVNGTFEVTDIHLGQNISFVNTSTDTPTGTLSAKWTGRALSDAAISNRAKDFRGAVVVESGASWLIGNGYEFSSVTVESGGQFGLDGTYKGNITISGTGVSDSTDADQKNGALKFGPGGTLNGNVTISSAQAALSTWGDNKGTIDGNISFTTGEDISSTTQNYAELELLNGDTGKVHTADNTITVTGNLLGIKQVTTTAASMTVEGTIEKFGNTFTKGGAGTLTLSGANTYTGATAVTDGKLKVTGSIGKTSSVAVSGDGVLEISGKSASVTAGGITATTNSANPGTAKKVTIGASDGGTGITGATSGDGDTLKALGEMSRMTLAFAAESTAAAIRNVTMRDVTLDATATNGTVTYTNAKAEAATTMAPTQMLYTAATSSETPQTLTAMAVQKGGTAAGTLTIDVTSELLRANFGSTLNWTFLDQVTLTSDFKVELGDILAGIVRDGLPKVYLTVGDRERTKLTTENFDDICITTAAGAGGLLAGTTGAVDVTLTIENVPEPTTGTLSVLALAALAARRRRRE